MTVLDQYQRLECTALWREGDDGQRREVIVSLGEASLIITDKLGAPLSHWSLPAVSRLNGGEMPAIYGPGGDAVEVLEIEDDLMVEGIETVRSALLRRRARPGRLRTVISLGLVALALGLVVFWLPGAMMRYTASVVPAAKRAEIGAAVLGHVHRITGGECQSRDGTQALARLWARLGLPEGGRIVVLKDAGRVTAHLPGGLILVARGLVEDYDTPEVLAGHAVAEVTRAGATDPLLELLQHTGLTATLRLLTTGDLPAGRLADYGEWLLTGQSTPLSVAETLAAFATARIPSGPYAYALDLTGEEVLPLIEADPFAEGGAPALLRDAAWIQLQEICEP